MSRVSEIATLSLKDVLHEWRMSLCVMFAVAAIATPLLLFFGLKSGIINTLKERLLSNPATVELVSVTDRRLDDAWFAALRADPKVAFVIPRTRRLAASAEFSQEKAGKTLKKTLDLYPTAAGDPLLAHYGLQAPAENECVLSQEASRRLGAETNDRIKALISRDRGSTRVEREFTVSGILPEAAGTVACAYINLPELEEIERFKDGLAVPKRNWPGTDSIAYPVTPEVIVGVEARLDAVREAMLIQNTGFARFSRLEGEEALTLHPKLPAELCYYRISTVGNPALSSDLKALTDRLRGRKKLLVLPFNDDLSLRLAGFEFKLRPLKPYVGALSWPDAPVDSSDFSATPSPRVIYLSDKVKAQLPAEGTVVAAFRQTATDGSEIMREVSFKARLEFLPQLPEDLAFVPLALQAQLGLLSLRDLSDGQSAGGKAAFTLKKISYTGFRMYAANLNDVVALQEQLTEAGIKTLSKADRISEVLSLDRYLSLLFTLIASASLLGATCCLVANIYANVERKRRELAVLRLLGVHSMELCVFPLISALCLTLGGMLLALLSFYSFSAVINSLFAYQLIGEEKFCDLKLWHAAAAVGIAAGVASLSGLLSSRRVLHIEVAESLRDE